MKFFSFFCIAIIVLLLSCKTRQVAPKNYLDNITDTSINGVIELPEPMIQKNDLLSIKVYSASIDPAVDLPYNLPEQASGGAGAGTSGFLVDANGNIEYPRLGTLHAEGLTKLQLAELIKGRLEGERQLTR
ncbi:MAG TPA: polysaccharide biosynthesis/export family protein, partial [Flavisolibacter sp.]|nr:polysaccharide biosynthesis/export family protein [Flavisolibacter sp.]